MANWMKKSDMSPTFVALAVILAALPTLCASSLTPWPYLQVYPPVNESDDSAPVRAPLYFALVLSSGGQYTSIGALPAVQVALDYVNSQPDILPGYSLHYTLSDSQVMRIVYTLSPYPLLLLFCVLISLLKDTFLRTYVSSYIRNPSNRSNLANTR